MTMPPNDKYCGNVVEVNHWDIQLPLASCLTSTKSVSRTMESSYDCDVSHIL
ncbi:hypothetical protein BD769DRAFT_1356212 [Suillus cothurnatus]|nr:hypothetical protein BD769DRAFT_1356212 [Suillus cothurnatus]